MPDSVEQALAVDGDDHFTLSPVLHSSRIGHTESESTGPAESGQRRTGWDSHSGFRDAFTRTFGTAPGAARYLQLT